MTIEFTLSVNDLRQHPDRWKWVLELEKHCVPRPRFTGHVFSEDDCSQSSDDEASADEDEELVAPVNFVFPE